MTSTHTLYHNYYSICSVMVRFTLAMRGKPKDEASDIRVEEESVDIFREEQLSEKFLCEINQKGQVPVLTSPALDKPMPDSLKITHYFAELYPSLIPESHKSEIRSLLAELHGLNFFSLTFAGRRNVALLVKKSVEKRLNDDGISDSYRKALEFKLAIQDEAKVGGLEPEVVSTMTKRAATLLQKFESLLAGQSPTAGPGPWIFGLESPTALDAHLITFIARLRDVGRDDLIPEKLAGYADLAMQLPEWKNTMDGRRTMMGK